MRNKFSETLFKNIKKNKNIFVVAADISPSGAMAKFQKSNKNFINVGVAEQNLIGISSGLAKEGKCVICYSIANFLTLRCLEQIRNDSVFSIIGPMVFIYIWSILSKRLLNLLLGFIFFVNI